MILNKDSKLKRTQHNQEILDDVHNARDYCSFYSYTFS